MNNTAAAPATNEFTKGCAAGRNDALRGFGLDEAYTGAYGAGYRAGWLAAVA